MSICSTDLGDLGPLVVKPKEARQLLRCSNTRLYELLGSGELDSFLDGRSRKIIVQSIHRYITRRLAASVASSESQQQEGSQPTTRGKPCKSDNTGGARS